MTPRSTRRRFLSQVGAAGLGAGLGAVAPAGADAAVTEATTAAAAVPFYGRHQAGIATPTQEHLQFATLRLASSARGDLAALLAELSSAAAKLTNGKPVGPLLTGDAPPVDTGEAVGLGRSRLTVTFGLGPGIFARGRFGLHGLRPAPLVNLPQFTGDALQPGISGGDIGIQVCADDPQVAFHAIHNLIRIASPTAEPHWALAGFGKTSNSRAQATPRNLMGFKDGTNNIVGEDAAALNRFVWASRPVSPGWMSGGSYMVVRRIRMLFGRWDEIGLSQQELTFGRRKLSGAPLGAAREHDPVPLEAGPSSAPVIPHDAHIRLASPSYSGGERMLRRGYSYVSGIDGETGTAAGGLFFICFQRDPRKQFIPIQRRLANQDALSAHIVHIGSAIFACPPGARVGGYVGESLLR